MKAFFSNQTLIISILTSIFLSAFFACAKDDTKLPENVQNSPYDHPCTDVCTVPDHDFIYYEDGQRWLKGGNDPSMDFNITQWSLEDEQLKFGLGRELFKALINPNFVTKDKYPYSINSEQEVIVLQGENQIKVYSLDLLSAHEVINDEIGGHAIAVVYCPLADYAAVYSRDYCGATFTFALSGYTHTTWDGRDGFVFWDRNTESLWFPFINRGVSGDMFGEKMTIYSRTQWEVIPYEEVLQKYSNFILLKPNQTIDYEGAWTQTLSQNIDCGG